MPLGKPRLTRAQLRDIVPFQHDPVARYVVAVHRDGLTNRQIATALGLFPSQVHEAAVSALRKLEVVCSSTVEGRQWRAAVIHLLEVKERADRDEHDVHG